MSFVSEQHTGILVLAGLFDPVGDIGTQCRYDLLPIPWNKIEFAVHVSNMINFELNAVATSLADPFEVKALSNGIGLRAWLRLNADSQLLSELLVNGWSEKRGELVGKEIDWLSFHISSINYQWPHIIPNDEAAINKFEAMLLKQLENYA